MNKRGATSVKPSIQKTYYLPALMACLLIILGLAACGTEPAEDAGDASPTAVQTSEPAASEPTAGETGEAAGEELEPVQAMFPAMAIEGSPWAGRSSGAQTVTSWSAAVVRY